MFIRKLRLTVSSDSHDLLVWLYTKSTWTANTHARSADWTWTCAYMRVRCTFIYSPFVRTVFISAHGFGTLCRSATATVVFRFILYLYFHWTHVQFRWLCRQVIPLGSKRTKKKTKIEKKISCAKGYREKWHFLQRSVYSSSPIIWSIWYCGWCVILTLSYSSKRNMANQLVSIN